MSYLYIFVFLLLLYLLRRYLNGPATKLSKDMNGKVAVITGASAGIGKETARDLLIKGATVIFATRDEKKTINVIKELCKTSNIPNDRAIHIKLELTSLKSVINFVDQLKQRFNKIDILINNAGIVSDNFRKTEDGIESTFQTNHVSHVLLTLLIFDMILESPDARIINVGSDAYKFAKHKEDYFNFEEKGFSFFNSYALTKLANVYFTWALNNFCNKNNYHNIKSGCLHPGAVYTEILRLDERSFLLRWIMILFTPLIKLLYKTERMGAQTTLHLCYLDSVDFVDGGYYKDCKLTKVSKNAHNKQLQDKINKLTCEIIQSSPLFNEKMIMLKEFIKYLN